LHVDLQKETKYDVVLIVDYSRERIFNSSWDRPDNW